MTRRFRAVLAALVLVALSACGSSPSGAVGSEGSAPPSGPLPPAEIWNVEEGWVPALAAPGAAPARRWVVDLPPGAGVAGRERGGGSGVIVTTLPEGTTTRVTRLDAATGAQRWSVSVPTTDARAKVTGVAAPVVVVTSIGEPATIVDAADGRTLWRGPDRREPSVDVAPETLLVRTSSGTALVDRATGTLGWQVRDEVFQRPGNLLLQTRTGSVLSGYGIADPATGTPRWTLPRDSFADDAAFGDVVAHTVDVDSPAPDTLTVSDPATGVPRWTVPAPGLGRSVMTRLDDRTLVVAARNAGADLGIGPADGGTIAVDVADGRVLWTQPAATAQSEVVRVAGVPLLVTAGAPATVVDGRTGSASTVVSPGGDATSGSLLYGSSDEGNVVATETVGGRERWRVAVPDLVSYQPVAGGFVAETGLVEPRRLMGFQS